MVGVSPANFTITGTGFFPSGSVTIEVMNSAGAVVASSSTTADTNGAINVSVPSSQVLSIGQNVNGTYNGKVQCIDVSTGQSSNAVAITLAVTIVVPTISVSPSNFTYTS